MAAERVTTAAAIENAREAELRVGTEVSPMIDTLVHTFDFAPTSWPGSQLQTFCRTPSPLVWDAICNAAPMTYLHDLTNELYF
eukprot:4292315-Prymnesium_polylepis.1